MQTIAPKNATKMQKLQKNMQKMQKNTQKMQKIKKNTKCKAANQKKLKK